MRQETAARRDVKTRQNYNDIASTSRSGKRDGLNDLEMLRDTHTCVICLENLTHPDKQHNAGEATLSVFPGCNHCFHTTCLKRWLANNLTCPLCRRLAPTVPISFWNHTRSSLYYHHTDFILILVRLGTLISLRKGSCQRFS
ncbi:hypothetical protein VP01_4g14 [Puccinia sorghi]|uniref:RING-type domain-containing protein n=1 Tax=Puccinia sorghi TaxID=27349 RepID=A0A0L6ULQ4_9BASI|nr:hypothetical protein VP01_4g14 [Puccinia sorghi]